MLMPATLFALLFLIPTAMPMSSAVPATAHSRRMHPDKKHEDHDPKPVILEKFHGESPFSQVYAPCSFLLVI